MTDWLILTATLPTNPSALRVRVWRALKATGAGTLREGVYHSLHLRGLSLAGQ